jgi:hypothetical protein
MIMRRASIRRRALGFLNRLIRLDGRMGLAATALFMP